MSKTTKKINKNIKKTKEIKKDDDKKKNNILTISKILFGILLCTLLICIITKIVEGNYLFINSNNKISTTDIIAGQTFNKQKGTYYVAFYDFTSTSENLTSTIDGLSANPGIYRVDTSSGFNKRILGTTENKNAQNVQDLKISQPTIIKITDGENVEYTSGYDNCVTYLNNLK